MGRPHPCCCRGCPKDVGDWLCPYDSSWTAAEREKFWVKGKTSNVEVRWLCTDPWHHRTSLQVCPCTKNVFGCSGEQYTDLEYWQDGISALETIKSIPAVQVPGTHPCDPWRIDNWSTRDVEVTLREEYLENSCCQGCTVSNTRIYTLEIGVYDDNATATLNHNGDPTGYTARVWKYQDECRPVDGSGNPIADRLVSSFYQNNHEDDPGYEWTALHSDQSDCLRLYWV